MPVLEPVGRVVRRYVGMNIARGSPRANRRCRHYPDPHSFPSAHI